ncbi:hypothetical protein UPYG_G00022810 [Umbra pygmaea]|uniref:Uncharacterized protein n=1 Tax=Umbra pygmaea TaxID=75934 RepID=A0ABD0XL86_UMBPY
MSQAAVRPPLSPMLTGVPASCVHRVCPGQIGSVLEDSFRVACLMCDWWESQLRLNLLNRLFSASNNIIKTRGMRTGTLYTTTTMANIRRPLPPPLDLRPCLTSGQPRKLQLTTTTEREPLSLQITWPAFTQWARDLALFSSRGAVEAAAGVWRERPWSDHSTTNQSCDQTGDSYQIHTTGPSKARERKKERQKGGTNSSPLIPGSHHLFRESVLKSKFLELWWKRGRRSALEGNIGQFWSTQRFVIGGGLRFQQAWLRCWDHYREHRHGVQQHL